MSTENNTSAISKTSTYRNESTNAWNPSDYSVAEQSLQHAIEYNERNGSQELIEEVEEFIMRTGSSCRWE